MAFDSLEMTFREFELKVEPDNEITFANADRIEVVDLDGYCEPRAQPGLSVGAGQR